MQTKYRIKGWSRFQHFRDRRPPWIKLYRDILDDIEWHRLDPLAAKSLVMLWLIASEHDGELPDIETLAFRLRMTENQAKSIVSKLSHWLEHDDINVISQRYQDDLPERETERETETETDSAEPSQAMTTAPAILLPTTNCAEYPITDSHVAEFRTAYPAVDVPQQLREMRAWLVANPTKRKTARGMLRFANTWLAREQDRGGVAKSSGNGVNPFAGAL